MLISRFAFLAHLRKEYEGACLPSKQADPNLSLMFRTQNCAILLMPFFDLTSDAPENKTEFRTSTGSHILLEGTSPNLLCNSVSHPLPSYDIWKLPTSMHFTLNGTLTLHHLNMGHEGMYHCQPKNEIGFGAITSLEIEIGCM